jgi:flagellin-like hook-associated protein FlgL
MSLVINTNTIANTVRSSLQANQANLQKSLARLSSGSKIVDPTDDAGGLAVSMKLTSALNRNARTQQNVQNTISFLQTQDGALSNVAKILDRMSELKTMSLDPTKNSSDIANYDKEFTQLQSQLSNIQAEDFNGIDLFNQTSDLTVYTTEGGDGTSEPNVTATRTGVFQDLGNITYGGADNEYTVTEYNSQGAYTAGTATTMSYVKSTATDGSVRLAYVTDNGGLAAAGHGLDFDAAIASNDLREITNVDAIYDHERGVAIARAFALDNAGAAFSTHEGGDIVFDDASGSFYLAAGNAFDFDSANSTTAALTVSTTPGEFLKLDSYPSLSDYSDFSSSDAYELGDIVEDNDSLYIATAAVAAGGAVPSGGGSWQQLSNLSQTGNDLLTTINTLSDFTVADFEAFLQTASTARAQNGAETVRLQSSIDLLKANHGNLDAARSALADVDIASESTNLAKQNILVQSAAAMLSQANASQNVALQLLA